jgi:acyl-CoA synthetase (AMP-forming)/AMP-acid ligase II
VTDYGNELILARSLRPRCIRHPHRPFIIGANDDYSATYAQHVERVLRLANAFSTRLDVHADDRFAVLSLNSHQYFELWHAALVGSGIIVPLNSRLSVRELTLILSDAQPKVLFVDQHHLALANEILASLDGVTLVVIDHDDAHVATNFEDMIAGGDNVWPDEPNENDAAVLMYTGGTTGTPKGALISHRALILSQYHVQMVAPILEEWKVLQHTPMFHIGALAAIVSAPKAGATVVYLPTFDIEDFLTTVERFRIDYAVLLPTLIGRILADANFTPERLGSLRRTAYGGSPITIDLMNQLREACPSLELTQIYGMTETCANLTILTDSEHFDSFQRQQSVGRALPGVEITILDVDGRVRDPNEIGEVCVRGGSLMLRYWNRPEETAAATEGGWYHTGDLGYLDAEGYLFVVDRIKDMIITGGENVYSIEVENVLATCPKVQQVAVVGLSDEEWGEIVVAIIVPVDGDEPGIEELANFCRRHLARYKVPKQFHIRRSPLPVSGVNKVDKQRLRREFDEPSKLSDSPL